MADMKQLLPWVNQIRVVFKWRTGKGFKYDAYDPNGEGFLTKEVLVYLVRWGFQ